MNFRILNQQAGTNPFHQRLENALRRVSSRSLFQVLTAFVKISGLNLISQTLENYLRCGGRTHWIVGLDLGITSPDALKYLNKLETRFQKQVNVQIFSAGNHYNVFHPKLYLIRTARKLLTWVGSANVTGGGMFSNFECLVELDIDRRREGEMANHIDDVWTSYASPSSPNARLENLTPELISQVEKKYGPEQRTESITPSHPLSHIDRRVFPTAPIPPRLRRDGSMHTQQRLQPSGNELIMEILQETRETQVQLPIYVLSQYFGIRTDEAAVITIRNRRDGQARHRPIVHLLHNDTHRIEVESIKGLKRPLIMKFARDPFRSDMYEYELLKHGSRDFRRMNRLLQTQGHQTRASARRWLVR